MANGGEKCDSFHQPVSTRVLENFWRKGNRKEKTKVKAESKQRFVLPRIGKDRQTATQKKTQLPNNTTVSRNLFLNMGFPPKIASAAEHIANAVCKIQRRAQRNAIKDLHSSMTPYLLVRYGLAIRYNSTIDRNGIWNRMTSNLQIKLQKILIQNLENHVREKGYLKYTTITGIILETTPPIIVGTVLITSYQASL